MRNIFIGFLLTFLKFNITVGDCIIGLIPDFLAYIYIVKGIDELKNEDKNENQSIFAMRNFAKGMIIYTSILYALNLFNISEKIGLLAAILNLISTTIGYYMLFNVIKGIREIEFTYKADLQGETLRSRWDIMIFCQIALCVFIVVPILFVICMIIFLIAVIMFFVAFNETTKLYEELQIPQLTNNFD